MREIDFTFDSVQLWYCKCHRINFRHGGSYIEFPHWIKNKKTTINSENKDDKCFQFAVTVDLKVKQLAKQTPTLKMLMQKILVGSWVKHFTFFNFKFTEANLYSTVFGTTYSTCVQQYSENIW